MINLFWLKKFFFAHIWNQALHRKHYEYPLSIWKIIFLIYLILRRMRPISSSSLNFRPKRKEKYKFVWLHHSELDSRYILCDITGITFWPRISSMFGLAYENRKCIWAENFNMGYPDRLINLEINYKRTTGII